MTELNIPIKTFTPGTDSIAASGPSSDGPEISLIEILTQLALRKWLIVKLTGVAVLIGLLVALLSPVKYTATTKIMTPQQSQSSVVMMMSQLSASGAGSLAALAGGGGLLKNPNDIYVGLLASRPVADAIIHKFDLNEAYHSKDMTSARQGLAERTSLLSGKEGFISISVIDKDKKRAVEVANAYPNELRNLMKTLALTEASQRRLFYEEQMKQAKEALVNAELVFQQVQQKKGLVQPDAQAKAMIESIAAMHAQIASKQVQVQALRSYTTEQNPELQLVERQLSSMQGESSKLEQQSHSTRFGDIGLADVPGAGLEYLRADHEVRYQQALNDLLMKQYDAARLDEAKQAVVIQVVEPAIEPDRKTSPRRAFILLISFVAGMLSGCALVLFQMLGMKLESEPKISTQLRELKRAFSLSQSATAEKH